MVFGTTTRNFIMSLLIESGTLTPHVNQDHLDPSDINQFDQRLLYILACVKALNFRHIAFIGRKLSKIQQDQAYKILWHEALPQSENTFKRLKILCERGWVLPWRTWDPDRILTTWSGRAPVRKYGVFYILGTEGRRWLKKTLGITPSPAVVEELYTSVLPLARWLTASTCALTLEHEGFRILPFGEGWKERENVRKPTFRPDFTVIHKRPTAFYICDSPLALHSDFFVLQVWRGLNFMNPENNAVILVRTRESFEKIQTSMRGTSVNENMNKVYVGHLEDFRKYHGHCTVINPENKCETL